MRVNALKESFQKNISPVYIVKGNDSYLREKTLKIFSSLIEKEYSDFNISNMSLSDGASSIVDALQTLPVFDALRIVFVKDTGEKVSELNLKLFEKYIEDPNPTSILVLFSDGENLKCLEKKAEIVDCSRLDDAGIMFEIERMLDIEPSRVMDENAKRTLISFTQGDLSRIENELAKLKSYSDNNITVEDVKELVVPDLEIRVFDLSNAVSEKNNQKALKVLDTFIKDAEKPVPLFSMLINQYRRMLHLKLSKEENIDELAKTLGIKTGAIFNLKRVSKNYSQTKLKKIVEMLAEMQFQIVSESVDGFFALQNAVAMLMVI